jgi:dihydrofolate reductase
MLTIIAALDRDRAIGQDNTLPWHLPDDLRRFKALTVGRAVLMGRRTAESIGRALPGRPNLVLSRAGSAPFEGQRTVRTLDQARDAVGDDLVVAGGGEVYALCLPFTQIMFLTWVDTTLPRPDTHFPGFGDDQWYVTGRAAHPADERHEHAFEWVDYRRIDGSG